jgi:hypothetical protein
MRANTGAITLQKATTINGNLTTNAIKATGNWGGVIVMNNVYVRTG